jgi:TetR/AcrR family transcriptional regulator, transcriptional repressor of aconitase
VRIVPKVSAAHKQTRRRQIMDGARRAFAAHGYEATTVPVLEAETGLSRGAIFSYFRSKLELFVALAQDDQRRLLERWLTGGHEEVIRHVAEDDPEWIGVYLDVSRMLRTDPGLRARWQAMNPELQRELERKYTSLQERGEIRSDLALDTIGRFLGVVFDGLAVQQGARFGAPVDVKGTLELIRSALAPK